MNNNREIYLISGLGADKRAFNWIDLPGFNMHHINWIKPGRKEEISSYAQRLLSQVNHKSPVLIGLSFGGIIAIEMAKLINSQRVIIISSIKNRNEMPGLYRYSGRLGLNRLIPVSYFIKPSPYLYDLFGAKAEIEKRMMDEIFESTDRQFAEWAINSLVNWNNRETINNLVHIHGDDDKLFPIENVKPDHIIGGGGHLMVHNKADRINSILKGILTDES